MKRYINFNYNGIIETIDEMEINSKEDKKVFKNLLIDYQLAYKYCKVYSSQKCTKDWK